MKLFEKAKAAWRRRRYRYTLYLAIGLGVFFLASAVIAATMYGVLPKVAINVIPDMPQPAKQDRVLVFSPHCDDETIAVGGYDYQAVKNGASVNIALVTDCNKHGWKDTRYKEFKSAAKTLGIPEDHLEFWGFKEGAKTETDLGAIKDMMAAEIKTYNPTVIIAPMTQDAHFDHYLTAKAAIEAMAEANYQGQKYGYLVHHRFYPQPKGYKTSLYLTPPLRYLGYGEGWVKQMLSQEAVDAKNEAVLGYKSQLRIPLLNTLLKSMIRQDEVFIRLD